MRHTHHANQWLPYSVETVFNFFANPENLPLLMPAWQKTRIENAVLVPPPPPPPPNAADPAMTSSRVAAAGQGTRLTIRFRPIPWLPLRMAWDAEIVEFVWNEHFCDIQRNRGPFAYWRHCHWLEARPREGKPGTLLRDQVEYELPFGTLGNLVNDLVLSRQLDYIFAYRQRRAEELIPRLMTAVSA